MVLGSALLLGPESNLIAIVKSGMALAKSPLHWLTLPLKWYAAARSIEILHVEILTGVLGNGTFEETKSCVQVLCDLLAEQILLALL